MPFRMKLGFPRLEGPQLSVAFRSALKVPVIFGDATTGAVETTFPIFPTFPKIGLMTEKSFNAEFPIPVYTVLFVRIFGIEDILMS